MPPWGGQVKVNAEHETEAEGSQKWVEKDEWAELAHCKDLRTVHANHNQKMRNEKPNGDAEIEPESIGLHLELIVVKCVISAIVP